MSPHAPSTAWPDDLTVSSLQLIADSTTTGSRDGSAAIGIVRAEDVEVVVTSGAAAPGGRTPLAVVEEELRRAPARGLYRELPDGRLVAPFSDAEGRLRGVLTLQGLGGEQAALDRYAERAGRTLLTALARARLAEEVRQAETARQVIRAAGRLGSLDEILRETAPALMTCFDSAALWWHLTEDRDHPAGTVIWADGRDVRPAASLGPPIATAAERLWAAQDVLIVGPEQVRNVRDPEAARLGLAYAAEQGLASLMVVPIGVRDICLGAMVLSRATGRAPWTEAEMRTARILCGDLGRALHNRLELERESAVVEELRSLDRARGDLLRTVSHELKNPLTAILGNLELLEEEDLAPDLVDHAVGRIGRGVDRMERIVADLTTFSAAGEELRPVPVDLLGVVREACDLAAPTAARRGQSLRVEAPDGPLSASGDPAQLDRVVANLVDNAMKYTPDRGHVTLTLARTAEGGRPMVELVVADDGIGIPLADQAHLFGEFFRSAEPRARRQPGTGLGLAIAARIVARHGGTIDVESAPDAGSRFRVRLPEAP